MSETYIEGVGDGYTWANAWLAQQKMPLIFCHNGSPTRQQFNQLAVEAVARYRLKKGPGNIPMSLLLEYRLREKYPCR